MNHDVYASQNRFPPRSILFLRKEENELVEETSENENNPLIQTFDIFEFPPNDFPIHKIVKFIQVWGQEMKKTGNAVNIANISDGIRINFPIDPSYSLSLIAVQLAETRTSHIRATVQTRDVADEEVDESVESMIQMTSNTILESFMNEVKSNLYEALTGKKKQFKSADDPELDENGDINDEFEENPLDNMNMDEFPQREIALEDILSPEELASLWEDVDEADSRTGDSNKNDEKEKNNEHETIIDVAETSKILAHEKAKMTLVPSLDQTRSETVDFGEVKEINIKKEEKEEKVAQINKSDPCESLLFNASSCQRSDYYNFEKLIFHWLTDFQSSAIFSDLLSFRPVDMIDLPMEVRKATSQATDISPYSSRQLERAIELRFSYQYHHSNGSPSIQEDYVFYFLYYYFPETQQIQGFLRRTTLSLQKTISPVLDTSMMQFQEAFVQELERLAHFFYYQSPSSSVGIPRTNEDNGSARPRINESEFQKMMDDQFQLDNLGETERALTEMNYQNYLINQTTTSLSLETAQENTLVQNDSETWSFQGNEEEELLPLGLERDNLFKKKKASSRSSSNQTAASSSSSSPEKLYSDDPYVAQKPWKEPPTYQQRLAQVGVEAEKFRSPSLQEEAVREMNQALTQSRKKGFFQAVQEYQELVLANRTSSSTSLAENGIGSGVFTEEKGSSQRQEELRELFEQGKRLSELNLQRLIDQNAGEPSSKFESITDLSESFQEKMDLFQKILTNQESRFMDSTSSVRKNPTDDTSTAKKSPEMTQISADDEIMLGPSTSTAAAASQAKNPRAAGSQIPKSRLSVQNITNPIERERIYQLQQWARNKLELLLQELETQSIDLHPMILNGFRDLYLSDYFIDVLEDYAAASPPSETGTVSSKQASKRIDHNYRNQVLFPKIIQKTIELYQELIALMQQESERHLQTIHEICQIAQTYQGQNELQFLNALDQIKYKFDVPLLQYLAHLLRQYEEHFEAQQLQLVQDPKLLEVVQSATNPHSGESSVSAMRGDRWMKAREVFTVNGKSFSLADDSKEETIRWKEDYQWYHILAILYNGVLFEFEHRYEILLDFLFILLRFDSDEAIHKILFQNIVNTIPVVDLKYFQLLARNLVRSILYHPNPSKELQAFIQSQPSIIRQVLILEQDLFCYCNDEIIERKLAQFQERLKERGETMVLRHRNPEKQEELERQEEKQRRDRKTSFGYLKDEEERFEDRERQRLKSSSPSSMSTVLTTDKSRREDRSSIQFLDEVEEKREEERQKRIKDFQRTVLDDQQRFPAVLEETEEEDGNENSNNNPSVMQKKEKKESSEKRKRMFPSNDVEEEANPKREAYYRKLEQEGFQELLQLFEAESSSLSSPSSSSSSSSS